MTNPVDASAAKRDSATQDARDQAAEFEGFAASLWYTAPDGTTFEVPNIALLDDDQQERFNDLQFEFSKCDKPEPTVIPGRTVRETTTDDEGKEVVTEIVTPDRVIPPPAGAFIQPYQKDGQLVKPSYNVQIVQAFLGEDGYAQFKAAKGKSSEYAVLVGKLNNFVAAREGGDPKSDGSVSVVEDVSD